VTTTRCVHGIDSRFCSICNRRSAFAAPRGAISSVTLPDILEFLEAEQIRAAPRAIAEIIGVDARTLAAQLDADTAADGVAPDISSGTELLMRLTAWKAKRSSSAT
jgi:hypothetical protein